ncbi:uncharacterized protein [Nothobranchius furzeri]|uniref:uncharacterized protein n=1 Tax=Nothobranchius furzeri TaxID=105023 RepID=UPI0039048D88
MKDGMDSEWPGQADAESHRVNDPLHRVGSHKPCSEFPGASGQAHVLGRHPYPVARLENQPRPVAASVLASVLRVGSLDGCPSTDPGEAAMPDQGLGSGALSLRFLVVEERSLVPVAELEWGKTSGRGNVEIMGHLRPQEVFGPSGWLRRGKAAEIPTKLLIGMLGLPIGLGVVTRGETATGTNQPTEGFPESGHELGPPI